jgi:hypothetical protein
MSSIDPDRIMLKKIILTGNPIRVRKRSGVVKHMFYDAMVRKQICFCFIVDQNLMFFLVLGCEIFQTRRINYKTWVTRPH